MILCTGCSFTAGMMSNYQWYDKNGNVKESGQNGVNSKDSWPSQLAKMLGTDYVNAGYCGASNGLITQITIDNVYKYNPDVVFVGWSEATRISLVAGRADASITCNGRGETYVSGAVYGGAGQHFKKFCDEYLKVVFGSDSKESIIKKHLRESLIHMKTLESFLKQKNIKFVFGQATNLLNGMNEMDIDWEGTVDLLSKFYYDKPYYKDLDDSKWVNYPGMKFVSNDGETFQDHFYENKLRSTDTQLWLEPFEDSHPGLEGHAYMAKKYYDKYKELYSG
jgi:hypothetical protein